MNKSELKDETCKICGNSKENKGYVAREMMFGLRDEFAYFQCNNCKALQISEYPEDMSKYYSSDYYSYTKKENSKSNILYKFLYKNYYSMLVNNSKLLNKISDKISTNSKYKIFRGIKIDKETRILDVGCGSGMNFLFPLAEIGFNSLLGCDPFLENTILYSNGLEIKNTPIFEVQGKWDIITYHHSFEHVMDPLENLKKIFELLNTDGVCVIRIPTVSSFAWTHYQSDWVQLDAPRHFFLHSVESMKLLAEISNLDMFRIDYDSTHFQFTGSEGYKKNIPLSAKRPKGIGNFIQRKIKKLKYIDQAKKLNSLNNGDQAAFYFRKAVK